MATRNGGVRGRVLANSMSAPRPRQATHRDPSLAAGRLAGRDDRGLAALLRPAGGAARGSGSAGLAWLPAAQGFPAFAGAALAPISAVPGPRGAALGGDAC